MGEVGEVGVSGEVGMSGEVGVSGEVGQGRVLSSPLAWLSFSSSMLSASATWSPCRSTECLPLNCAFLQMTEEGETCEHRRHKTEECGI